MTATLIPSDIVPVEPGYRSRLMVGAALVWAPVLVGSLVLDRLVIAPAGFGLILPLIVAACAVFTIVVAPRRIYRRLGYALDDRLLRVVRGWLFHTDTVVPFVRVQHIDVTSGPLDKMFGIASLVVHTAGTHNSVVVLPGLRPDRAADIRDSIRAEIRADAE